MQCIILYPSRYSTRETRYTQYARYETRVTVTLRIAHRYSEALINVRNILVKRVKPATSENNDYHQYGGVISAIIETSDRLSVGFSHP
jgi:hypothetical protein